MIGGGHLREAEERVSERAAWQSEIRGRGFDSRTREEGGLIDGWRCTRTLVCWEMDGSLCGNGLGWQEYER